VEKAVVIPFEVPVPCDKIVEKLVLVEKEVEKIVQVPVTV
jgi:sulfopyruvate decarboxylase TPP-binding subunit